MSDILKQKVKTVEKVKADKQKKLNNISHSQFGAIVFLLLFGSKIFSLPLLFLSNSGRVVWMPFLALILLDFIVLFLIVGGILLSGNKTAAEVLASAFGKILTKIIFLIPLFALFFKTIIYSIYVIDFVKADFLQGFWEPVIILVFVLFLALMGSISLRGLGRFSQVKIIFVVIAIVAVLALSFSSIFSGSLILFSGDFKGSLRLLLFSGILFGDGAAMFIAFGKVKKKEALIREKKGKPSKGIFGSAFLGAIFAGAIIIVFTAFLGAGFAGVAQLIGPTSISISTQTAVSRFSLGRFDRIFWLLVLSAAVFAIATIFIACTKSFSLASGIKNKSWCSALLGIALLIVFLFANRGVLMDFTRQYSLLFFAIFSLGFPLVLLIAAAVTRKKGRSKSAKKKA